LHYLLLARPELHVAQGLLTSDSGVTFLFGIGGLGIRKFAIPWSNDLDRLMYAFLYRLYDPGYFADSSYTMVHNLEKNLVTYTVQITVSTEVAGAKEIICPDLLPIYASSPFGTRTHILSNPDSEVKVNGKTLTVVKDQLCRVGTRFDEHSILERIHKPENVPGVVEAVYHHVHAVYHHVLAVPFCKLREKHRMGLRQVGMPFATIPTVQQMLEIVFDTLEGRLSLLFTTFCTPTPSQCCGTCALSAQSFIVTSAWAMFSMSRTISPLQLMLCHLLSAAQWVRRLGRGKSPSVSLSISLGRGM
jgi:hypothetical protein